MQGSVVIIFKSYKPILVFVLFFGIGCEALVRPQGKVSYSFISSARSGVARFYTKRMLVTTLMASLLAVGTLYCINRVAVQDDCRAFVKKGPESKTPGLISKDAEVIKSDGDQKNILVPPPLVLGGSGAEKLRQTSVFAKASPVGQGSQQGKKEGGNSTPRDPVMPLPGFNITLADIVSRKANLRKIVKTNEPDVVEKNDMTQPRPHVRENKKLPQEKRINFKQLFLDQKNQLKHVDMPEKKFVYYPDDAGLGELELEIAGRQRQQKINDLDELVVQFCHHFDVLHKKNK